jgi:hypothetical protein
VEDIIDSGHTLARLSGVLQEQGRAASVKVGASPGRGALGGALPGGRGGGPPSHRHTVAPSHRRTAHPVCGAAQGGSTMHTPPCLCAPACPQVVALLDKKGRRRVEMFPDYVGWEVRALDARAAGCARALLLRLTSTPAGARGPTSLIQIQ